MRRRLVAAVVAIAAVTTSAACDSSSDDGATATRDEGQSADSADSRESGGGGGGPVTVSGDYPSLQKWADDVSAGDEAALVRKCWTYPASYIRDRYLGSGKKLNEILSATDEPGQSGVRWQSQSGQVFATDPELNSTYACPQVTLDGQDMWPDDYVAYRVERFIRREQGDPVNPGDTDSNGYDLTCGLPHIQGEVDNVDNADPGDVEVSDAPRENNTDTWKVTSNGVEFTVIAMLGNACIQRAS